MLLAPAMRVLDAQEGEGILWFRTMGACPCTNPQTRTWDRAHALCAGTGKLRQQIDTTGFLALVTGVRVGRRYDEQLGQLQEGDLLVSTWPNEIPLSEGDHVVIPSRNAVRTWLQTRGTGTDDMLPDRNNVAIATLFDSTGELKLGWEFVAPNIIRWTGAPAGSAYAVRYSYSPIYEVMEGSVLYRKPDYGGAIMPTVVGARLFKPNTQDGYGG